MRIVLDAMGGDHAPGVTVQGAVDAARQYGHEIILTGPRETLEKELLKYDVKKLPLSIHTTTETITMDDLPAQAVRQKKDSSMVVAARLVAEKKGDAFISAGNSGAAMASALLCLGRIPGISRPAIATLLPTIRGVSVVLDVGANVDCKPKHLLQFALMGKIYMEQVYSVKNPKVGLLTIGTEQTKGNELTLATYDILKKTDLNFIGNIEGNDITKGTVDVVVCDGFIGNIVLKFGEGVAGMMLNLVKQEFKAHPIAWASLPFLWPALNDLRKKVDYTEYGGAPLLGVDGVCIIGHGSSNAKAIKNAVHVGALAAQTKLNTLISADIARYEALGN